MTETVSRHAIVVIEKISAPVEVETSMDHGSTNHLRVTAENLDIFVLNYLSAKHAATDFIRAHHGTKSLFYSQGKGFSSIILINNGCLNFKNFT